jgi:hypothetical protein
MIIALVATVMKAWCAQIKVALKWCESDWQVPDERRRVPEPKPEIQQPARPP